MFRKYPPVEIGQRFHRLVAVGEREPSKLSKRNWQCDCGNTINVRDASVRSGLTQSCGCLQRERASAALSKTARIHGMSKTPEFAAWMTMRARCNDPRVKSWRNYGGRGITVCPEWSTFERFFADMGPRPGAGFSLDRIDNEQHYRPSNCRWADSKTQIRNRRATLAYPFDGSVVPLSEIAERVGIRYRTLYARLSRGGWTLDRAISEPIKTGPR